MDYRGIKPAGWKELVLWVLGRRRRFRVEGDSMLPLLHPGDEILVKKTTALSAGDVIVLRHPMQADKILIKQIEKVACEQISVIGFNVSASSDSRAFGAIPMNFIMGTVTSRLFGQYQAHTSSGTF